MEIKINTESLSALDREILRLVLGDNVDGSSTPAPSKAPAAAREAGVGRRLQAARKAKPEPEPDEDVEPDVEDVEADEEPEADAADEYDDVTIENAMELAQNMLRDGQRTKVVEALAVAGAKKVGELKGAQIAKFVKALSA